MNDLAPIFRRVAAINPVPDENDLPTNAMATTALLDVIDERTGTMQTQQYQTKPTEEPKRRRTWALVATATFVGVIVIGGAIAVTGGLTQDASVPSAAQSANASYEVIPLSEVVHGVAPYSMLDTIQPGALLTVDRSAYASELPERRDIVVYAESRPSDVTTPPDHVSRVIGLPGETIEAMEGILYVDGRTLDEPYLFNPEIPLPSFGPITLGADELWLMSDNRQAGADSLNTGAVVVSRVQGRVTEIVNP